LIRVAVPAASVAAVGVVTTVGMAVLLPIGGTVVGAGLLMAGVVAPAVTVWAAHRAERRTSAARGEMLGRTLELLEAAPDLLAFNAADRYRAASKRPTGACRRCCGGRRSRAASAAASEYWPSA
jgi:ATP-binding cassette subfamily C protein CydCD